MSRVVLAVLGGLLAGCVMPPGGAAPSWTTPVGPEPSPVFLTPDQVAERVTVEDDHLETVATLSTYPIHRPKLFLPSARGVPYVDGHLRAFIEKATGRVSYQVYVTIIYRDDWHFYEWASYLDDGTPQDVRTLSIARKVLSCAGGRPCLLSESVGFTVPDRVLRAAASEPDDFHPWEVRLRARSGHSLTRSLSAAEIAGLLKRVDTYPKPGTASY